VWTGLDIIVELFWNRKNKNSCYFTVFVQYLLKPLKLEEIVGK